MLLEGPNSQVAVSLTGGILVSNQHLVLLHEATKSQMTKPVGDQPSNEGNCSDRRECDEHLLLAQDAEVDGTQPQRQP